MYERGERGGYRMFVNKVWFRDNDNKPVFPLPPFNINIKAQLDRLLSFEMEKWRRLPLIEVGEV